MFDASTYPLQKETEMIISCGYEVQRNLGFGFLEIVYKDALEWEFRQRGMYFEKEKQYPVIYKGSQLAHSYFADFVIFESVILEVKAKREIAREDQAQAINYLRCSGCKVGLILNFGTADMGIKRVVL